MKIYDISQEVFTCEVFPGDPIPQKEKICSIENGDLYNLTAFSMCAHNGTHIDAPYHFLNNGKKVSEIDLSKTIGFAFVVTYNGIVTAEIAKQILKDASEMNHESAKRILIGGNAVVSLDAAKVFADAEIDLIGNESQTVGPEDAPMEVHKILLGANVVLLEGIRLCGVPDGVYFLNASPLSLADSDGSPCRAVLIDL